MVQHKAQKVTGVSPKISRVKQSRLIDANFINWWFKYTSVVTFKNLPYTISYGIVAKIRSSKYPF
jgi:hypothetical protein